MPQPNFVADTAVSESFFSDLAGITGGFTVPAATNNILIIECSYDSGTPQTPLVDGSTTDVVLLTSQLAPSSVRGINVYYKLNVTAANHSLSFQSTGATIVSIYARVYDTVSQVAPFGTPVKSGFTSVATLTLTVPTAIGDLVIDMAQWMAEGSKARIGTVGAGQTERTNSPGAYSDGRAGSDEVAVGTSTVMSWTLTAAAPNPAATPVGAQIAVVLNGYTATQAVALAAVGAATASFVGNWRVGSVLSALGSSVLNFIGFDAQPIPQRFYMSKGNTFETDILGLIFNATTIANIAINATASPLTNLYVALHTADPGEAGDQTTNETAYTGYARQPVARTSGGWTVASGSVSPVANIDYPVCTAAPGTTITHCSIGVAVSAASKILYSGALSPQIAIAIGVIPRITPASTITED